MKQIKRLRILAFFFGAAWMGAVIPAALAGAAEGAVFRESVEQLYVAQVAVAKGKLAEAEAAYSALLRRHDIPAHHRWEAEGCLQEIERMEKELPARDPAATRVALPSRMQLFENLETAEDPGFRNWAQGDFQLKDSAPLAVKIGWRPIPVDEIGLYADAYREELPPRVRAFQDDVTPKSRADRSADREK